MTSSRAITYIAGGVLSVVVIAAAVVLLAGGRAPIEYPAGSPQAAMQGYLAAWKQHDLEDAYRYFSDGVHATTTFAAYQRGVNEFGVDVPGEEGVFIDQVEDSGDRVTLHLTVEHYVSGTPAGDTYRTSTSVPMVRQTGGWKIDQLLMGVEPTPFPLDESPI